MSKKRILAGLGIVAAVPVVIAAPSPDRPGGRSIADLVSELRSTGKSGRELVDAAMQTVAGEFSHYSAWHLWERPETALKHGRGWSHQYNTVLLLVLRQLGFEARMVQAARVRGWGNPWWHVAHAWVKVTIDGRVHDACASRRGNRLGDLGFVPVSVEIPLRRVSRWALALFMAPFVVGTVWRAWLTGRPVPQWVYRVRPDDASLA